MYLSRIFNAINISVQEKYMTEILELNEKTKEFGLILTPDEVKNMMVARNKVLRDYGRVELGIEVTKELIEVFSESPYIHEDNYAATLTELHEIFYYLRNETEDKIGDFKLISMMKEMFDGECAGSVELLKSRLEEFAENFRSESLRESLFEGED
ncbi:DUF6323 family protein [Thermoactinomyces sp. CICC 10521]|uniref:DUF6323 family protein n=1 Tax=Thermoactinomyces sp. CICC 10521 TaxID=2767426 RepID=UPI0018DC6ECC|nr:DUF6323 family protein [Thermoactinomyces sp. CICC 10521]MBH8609160.1 hypothetical protein [Thermoactinomyces sp. CICC 10521]